MALFLSVLFLAGGNAFAVDTDDTPQSPPAEGATADYFPTSEDRAFFGRAERYGPLWVKVTAYSAASLIGVACICQDAH